MGKVVPVAPALERMIIKISVKDLFDKALRRLRLFEKTILSITNQ